ncbi:MAG: DUF308 domain-containing protein [Candidatus Saccharibacteria bacterium]|nr:DUF308 domain-containing protein [Candidatus Saccharibacteria bacterium]
MAHINRRYIDKHWSVFVVRGALALTFGLVTLFGGISDLEMVISVVGIFLLLMGIVDSVSALYASMQKRGWVVSVIDALIDMGAALSLMFFAKNNIVTGMVVIAVYTLVSGLVDVFHGFLSTVDPTDKFIRILTGSLGCVMGIVIFNSGEFEITTFLRFFGAYVLLVGVTSMIYGIHNRSQDKEDSVARKEVTRTRKTAKTVKAAKTAKTVKSTKATKKSKKTK